MGKSVVAKGVTDDTENEDDTLNEGTKAFHRVDAG
jgi:hypothetical protein